MLRCLLTPSVSFSSTVTLRGVKEAGKRFGASKPPRRFEQHKPFMPMNFAPLSSSHPMAQDYTHLLVLDFEATCAKGEKIQPYQEIIEFPVIAISFDSLNGWKEQAIFHQYVRPTVNPTLTTFCTDLTGIIQEMVDNAKTLPEVLADFDNWLEENSIKSSNFLFATCGDWDLQIALPSECDAKEIKLPDYFSSWVNVKKAYAEHTGEFPKGLKELLAKCKLTFEGRAHSGIDDTRNICRVAETLYNGGYKFHSTSTLDPACRIRKPRPLVYNPNKLPNNHWNRTRKPTK